MRELCRTKHDWNAAMLQVLEARRLVNMGAVLEFPRITMEAGVIAAIETGVPNQSRETLAPAFFDIHVHGAVSYDFMSATLSEMDAIGRFLASKGTAHYLATTITGPEEKTLHALDRLAKRVALGQVSAAATPVGIHLEGPFLCPAKRGVHPLDQIAAPSLALFDRYQAAANGHIRLMTVAPEMPGALDLIVHAVAQGVRISLGHSNATAGETEAAIAAGATSATHTFNAMRTLDHREPGLAGAVLDCGSLYAEAIVDGIHVHPAMVRLWLKMKGDARAILVTDGMSATGMPDGCYKLGELDVEVRNGVCLADGVLAGSVLTLDTAVRNIQSMTGASLSTAVSLASTNPAEMLGMPELTALRPGTPANFNVFDENGRRCASLLHGQRLPV